MMNNFFVHKDANGGYRWLCVYTNSLLDLDNDIITAAAHKETIAAVNNGAFPMPPLWLCHNEKWKIGQTDVMAYDEVAPGVVFVVASGVFDDGMEIVAKRLTDVSASMSHGLSVLEEGEFSGARTIERYRTLEISVLPDGIALPANPRTYYIVENQMGIQDSIRRGKLAQLFGQETVDAIESANDKIASKALDEGVVYKDAAEEVASAVEGETPVEDTPVATEESVEETPVTDSGDVAYATIADIEALASLVGEAIKALRDDLLGEQAKTREELKAEVAQVSATITDAKKEIERANKESVTPVAARPGFEALLKSMTRTNAASGDAQAPATPPEETKARRLTDAGPIGYIAGMVER